MRAATKPPSRLPGWAMLLVALVALAACGEARAPARQAVAVRADDVCAVCGMELSRSPGPRAQAWVEGRARPLMFDSTRDFFAYVLQPEHQANLQDLFVQDSARIDWQRPGRDADTFIDARTALYVAWQPLPGSMGPTLAPFATRAAADAFVGKHGGAVLDFSEVTLALVATLDYRCPSTPFAPDGDRNPRCTTLPGSAAGRTAGTPAPAPSASLARSGSHPHD